MCQRRELPEGTVTFLLTDIEGSTRLWEQHPEAMREALARHHALLTAAIEQHGGIVITSQGEGDSFFAVFARATDAVTAAAAVHRALLAEPWPTATPLRVRVALHTGEAELRGGDYYGVAVNRCARLRAAAHGGQVLLSRATQELVHDHLPEGMSLRDLGEYRLRDLIRPERIFQLLHPDLPAEFPPLRSLDVRPNNLPSHPTPFLGRGREMAALRERLQREDIRLVTLTGPGGTGKTRLALQAAAELLDAFEDGVYSVALAPIRDADLVAATIAQSLGVRETGSQPLLESLKSHLREKQLLLLLDNFEQVIGAASLVADLLQSCPRLKVMVTSRELLRLQGEHEFPVPPLALPDPRRLPEVSGLSQYAAVELFIQRAQAAKPEFAITNETAPAVAQICHRLDGLPLAIELAAARMRLFTPQALLERLGNRLKLLVGGARDLPERQQTLRSAITWSYDLLDEHERKLFRRLATFAGGFTLEAAEVVSDASGDPSDDPSASLGTGQALQMDVLEGVTSLTDKSLLQPDEGIEGRPRFTMLETIREFAIECLGDSAEAEATRRAHARFSLGLVEDAEPHFRGPEQVVWLDRVEAEHDNIRAALEWLQESDPETGLRLATALWYFWMTRGQLQEGRKRVAAALAHPTASGRTPARAKALRVAGEMARYQDDLAAARTAQEESVAIYRELGDRQGLAHSLSCMGMVFFNEHTPAPARTLLEESIPLFRETGDRWGLALALTRLGMVSVEAGDYAAARRHSEEGLAIWREVGDRWGMARPLVNLGIVAWREGDDTEARSRLEEAWALLREIGDWHNGHEAIVQLGHVARRQGDTARARTLFEEDLAVQRAQGHRFHTFFLLSSLGRVALDQGDYATAMAYYRECLTRMQELGWTEGIGLGPCLADLAELALKQGQPVRAARLSGVAAVRREAAGTLRLTNVNPCSSFYEFYFEQRGERIADALRAALGEEAFAAAWAEGRAMTIPEATAGALGPDDAISSQMK